MQSGDDAIAALRAVPGNHSCVDCDAADPEWASINLGVLMCLECSGQHRALGAHVSKVRSLQLDVDCWQGELLQFMVSVGNESFNRTWEARVPPELLRPEEAPQLSFVREMYIRRKYEAKEFLEPLRGEDAARAAGEAEETKNAGVAKEGDVSKFGGKEGSMFRRWQRRRLALEGATLRYYKEGGRGEAHGELALPGCEVVIEPTTAHGREHCFSVVTGVRSSHAGRRFVFQADSELERLQWVEAIRGGAGFHNPRSDPPGPALSPAPLEEYISRLKRAAPLSQSDTVLQSERLYVRVHPKTNSWVLRRVVLTPNAVFVVTEGTEEAKDGSGEAGAGEANVAIPLQTARVEQLSGGPAGGTGGGSRGHHVPRHIFALWCPLAYVQLGVDDAHDCEQWVASVRSSIASINMR